MHFNQENIISTSRQLRLRLHELIPRMGTDKYKVSNFKPEGACQYWELELNVYYREMLYGNYEDFYEERIICYLCGVGKTRNLELDINHFYKSNELIIDDFVNALNDSISASLSSLLTDKQDCIGYDKEDENKPKSLDEPLIYILLRACINKGSSYQKRLMEEDVLVISNSQNKLCAESVLNERKIINQNRGGISRSFNIPHDKVDLFEHHKKFNL